MPKHLRLLFTRLRKQDDGAPEGGGAPATPSDPVEPAPVEPAPAEPADPAPVEPDPREAELTSLREERDRLLAEVETSRTARPLPAEAPKYKDASALAARETELGGLIEWLYEHLDGYEGDDGTGKTVTMTSAEVRKKLGLANRELSADIPRERAALAAREASLANARREFPSHFDQKHPDSARVRAVFAEIPGLEHLPTAHRLAADILAGRSARRAPAPARPAVSAAAKPPVLPTGGATPPPSVKGSAVKLDGDGLRRGAPGSMLGLIMSTLPNA